MNTALTFFTRVIRMAEPKTLSREAPEQVSPG
ncbi:hypothetical protein SUDANB140_05459 [Streptomyces sp. enrichment culture]